MELTATHGTRGAGATADPIVAIAGGAAWLAAPLLPVGAPLPAGSLGHLLLLFPLVAAPLALAVLAGVREEDGAAPSRLLGIARRLQPAAAALLFLSSVLPSGRAAGGLALPWVGVTLAVALAGVGDAVHRRRVRLPAPSLLAAPLFLVVGGAWLLLWRLGAGPRSYSTAMVALAAVHFNFVGFVTLVLVGATGRRLSPSSRLRPLQGAVALATGSGLLLIAAGKALALPVARIAGVGAVTAALLGLAVTTTAVALASRSALARALLVASAASGAAAAALAVVYGAGELVGREWIGLGTMTATHGLLMALGLATCGLAGHLRLQRGP